MALRLLRESWADRGLPPPFPLPSPEEEAEKVRALGQQGELRAKFPAFFLGMEDVLGPLVDAAFFGRFLLRSLAPSVLPILEPLCV
jgi:hypothetical protein